MFYEGKNRSPVREYQIYGRVFVLVKDPLPESINLFSTLEKIEKSIPNYLLRDLDSIYIGQFDEFAERDINAFYRDGAIFATNDQIDDSDLMDDLVHEMAHSVESYYSAQIYGDEEIEQEFLGKRRRLLDLLTQHELDIDLRDKSLRDLFFDLKYSQKFDNILYKDIGYTLLDNVARGLFCNAYAVTSLREYFASGFEEFYMADRQYLKKISPAVFEKLQYLNNLNEE